VDFAWAAEQHRGVRALGLAVLLFCSPALALGVAAVPRPPPGTWVSDAGKVLRAATVQEINTLAQIAHQRRWGQLAVVVLDQLGGHDPRAFATELFNEWGVGFEGADNGVLLLLSIGDRAAEIILGSGIDSDPSVAHAQRIMDQQVVANMKRGDPDAAMLTASRALVSFLEKGPVPIARPVLPRGGPFPHPPANQADASLLREAMAALGLLGLGGLALLGRWWWRRHPRQCNACGGQLELLEEAEDDAYLDRGQRAEEKVGSVNYDVWFCERCEDVEIIARERWLSSKAKCVKCGYKTAQETTTTVTAATTTSQGEVRVTQRCAHCGHVHQYLRKTPTVSRSSGSSFRSSSSFRSGSSFGGGRSSGRGASGRW
jgi:uncharacterized protein